MATVNPLTHTLRTSCESCKIEAPNAAADKRILYASARFSMFSNILFSSAVSSCRDNEVAIVIVVDELFTRDLGCN